VKAVAEITVMVPVYNGEAYLSQCIDSILAQTFQAFQLLIVDDGSTDGSGTIADRYAQNDTRVRVIHQANGGLSNARNRALAATESEWLTFVDADDWLEPTCLSSMAALREPFQARMVACNHWIETPRGTFTRFPAAQEPQKLSYAKACENILYHLPPDVSAWGKLYHRSLFEGLSYPAGRLFEDTYLIADLLHAAGSVVMEYRPQYHYRFLENSISKSVTADHLWDFMDAVDHLTASVLAQNPGLTKACANRRVHAALSTKRLTVKGGARPSLRRANRAIRAGAASVLLNAKADNRNKFGILASLAGDRVYRAIWQLYSRKRRSY